MSVQHTASGAGSPASAPPSLSAHYLDTTTGDQYLAKGTASVDDWVKQGGAATAAPTPPTGFVWFNKEPTDIDFGGVAYRAGQTRPLVAVANEDAYHSSEGDYWSAANVPNPNGYSWNAIVAGANGMLIYDYAMHTSYTTDGINWTTTEGPFAGLNSVQGNGIVVMADGSFLATGMAAPDMTLIAFASTNGLDWTDVTSSISTPNDMFPAPLAYIPDTQLYVGVLMDMMSGAGVLGTSTDGLAWTALTNGAEAGDVFSVAYSAELGRYVFGTSTQGVLRYSDDGLQTFHEVPAQASGLKVFARHLIYVADVGLYIASSGNQSTWDTKLTVSRDGQFWVPVMLPQNSDGAYPGGMHWNAELKRLTVPAHQGVTYHARLL